MKVTSQIHSTRLKSRILIHFENTTEYHEEKGVLLAFKSDTGEALTSAASIDYDKE